MKLASRCLEDTQRVGHLLGNQLRKNPGKNVVLLTGQVGAGKSEFARSLIRSVSRSKHLIVTSPTFVLMNSYPVHKNRQIHHLDLYRLRSKEDLKLLNLTALYDRGDDLVVEWPELLRPLTWPHIDVNITGSDSGDDHRVISLQAQNVDASYKVLQLLDSAIKSSS